MVCFKRGRGRLLAVIILVLTTVSGQCFALNCVQYVRQVSGMDISGDGWQWWNNANGHYARGHAPKPNAVMVFASTDSMEHGHVAIVSTVMNSRLITINHANWARYRGMRGQVQTGVLVRDVSDKNDWSEVRVLDEPTQSFGRTNRILGFVYNTPGNGKADMVADNSEPDSAATAANTAIKDIDNE
jgi:hypothetical protein